MKLDYFGFIQTTRAAFGRARARPWLIALATLVVPQLAEAQLKLGLAEFDKVWTFELPRTPGLNALFLRTPFTSWVKTWETGLNEKLKPSLFASNRAQQAAIRTEEVGLIGARPDTSAKPSGILTGRLGEYADVSMRITGRGELGGAWTRYTPCDPGTQVTCNPGLFPVLKPEMQFGILVGGTVSERVHVNVDYDQTREFDAANNINVYYQGFEDEVLQRLEVGDVSIRLPASRFMTQGIPAGNFGFKATGQLGPLEFQTVFAQQRGDVTTREFKLGGLGAGQKLEQDAQLVLDDADYVEGQFFFIVRPDSLVPAPHIDALALRAIDADARLRPGTGASIQVYRDERPSLTNQQQQAQLGYFLARGENGGRSHTGLFRRLLPDQYLIHPSGLWLMLRSPLRADEGLAISYITETGDTVGIMNADNAPPGTTPVLKLLRGPTSMHQPGAPTWDYEMHQVYRLDSSNKVDPNTIDLRISLGDISGGRTHRDVNGIPISLLRLFGLDEDSPVDQIDPAQIYQPGRDPFGRTSNIGTTAGVTGTFVIFPTLKPFARPAEVKAARLSAAEVQRALGTDANPQIYDNPDPVVREGSGRFRLNFKYRTSVDGVVEQFNLGAFGIREKSERLFIGERQMVEGVDYTIDYDLGVVTLTDAPRLFAANPDAQLRATWEQKAVFQIAPTSVFGLNARYGLGKRGELNFVGLYQSEKTVMTRPQLGLEPSSIMLGGVSGRVDLGGAILDRALAHIPGLRTGTPSAMSVTGELALSLPNPNTRGDTYLDDFESTDEVGLPMSRRQWKLGSRPESTEHATSVLPFPLDTRTAAQLVWQHDIMQDGRLAGALPPRAIDSQIRVAGTELPEAVLWLTFGDSTPNTIGKRWRSMTTVLSTTGRDMTRSEYLEFYVWSSAARGQTLILDFGTLSEDAFFVDSLGQTNGTYPDGTRWGLGILDQEVRLADRELFSPDKDARGLWNQSCSANLRQEYALGDPDANCARNNGEPDSEDLDGNGVPDFTDQAYFRYVIPIDDTSPYLVRNTQATGTNFRLFRVPLRTEGRPVNGASDATWRFIKHLRMTVSSTPTRQENFVLARMRIVGARWTKRDVNGIIRGATSDQPSATAAADNLQVGPVSLLTDPEYAPPPGVNDELMDASQRFGATGIEFNEKALRLTYKRIAPGERAEVYYRYPQQSRGFLNYRQLRLFALARAGNWGDAGAMRFMVRAGNDPRNYYVYQSKLRPPVTGTVTPNVWLPEIVIDFEEWYDLRVRAEELVTREPPPPGQQLVLWNADSTYAIVLEDRARAPNLAAMRELAFSVYNAGNTFADGELWIDDMRLSAPFKDPGAAGTVNIDIRGADFLSANISYSDQGAVFRQLNQDARFQRAGDLSLATTAQLGQLLPSGWGIEAPLSFSHSRSGLDPVFLDGSDLRATRLQGLRETGADATRVNIALRKRTPSANSLIGVLIDGLTLRGGYTSAESNSSTTTSDAHGLDGGISYSRDLTLRSLNVTPGVVDWVLRFLTPARVEESAAFKRLTASRLRWSPERITFGTSYYKQERRAYQYNSIIELPGDSAVTPIESPKHGLENDAQISFTPFSTMRAALTFRSSRDLLSAERAANRFSERSAIEAARSRVGGLDVGWETNRSLTNEFSYRPELTPWLKPSINYTSRYGADRNQSYLEIAADSTAEMQRRFQADRSLTKAVVFEPAGLTNALLRLPAQLQPGDTANTPRGFKRIPYRLGNALQPIELNWNSTIGSQFERELHTPGWGYQFGLADFHGFRLIGGDTAVFVNARDVFTARSGLRLPYNATITAGYEENTLDAVDQRGGNRAENERRWPELGLMWSRVPLPAFLTRWVPSTSLSLNHSKAKQHSILGSAQDRRGGTNQQNSMRVQLGLRAGIAAMYNLSWNDGTSNDPTGDAEQRQRTMDLQLSANIQPPGSLREKLKAPIQASLGFRQDGQKHCRFRASIVGDAAAAPECVPFIDFQNRAFNLQFQTLVTDVTVGMNLSYNSRQSYVGTQNGNNQFQLNFFGQFNMQAGRDIPRGVIR